MMLRFVFLVPSLSAARGDGRARHTPLDEGAGPENVQQAFAPENHPEGRR